MSIMDHILAEAGWKRAEDFDPQGNPRPFYAKGRFRAIVGHKWSTFYVLEGKANIGAIKTVPTGSNPEFSELSANGPTER